MNQDEVLTLFEAAAFLKISTETLYQLARQKKVPCRQIGVQWRFSRSALITWIKSPSIKRKKESKKKKRK